MSTRHHTAAELAQSLDQLVPAIGVHGLTILAAGHSITLQPGRLADQIADLVAQDARLSLMRLGVMDHTGELA